MYKLRLTALVGTATLLLALGAAGVSNASPKPGNACDIAGLWSGSFSGSLPGDQGGVVFNITPRGDSDPPTSGDKDKNVKFDWSTTFVSNGATAQGTGKLKVTSPTTARFSISGSGTHPLAGPGMTPGTFTLDASGDITCSAGTGVEAMGTFHLTFQNGMSDSGTVGPLFHGGD